MTKNMHKKINSKTTVSVLTNNAPRLLNGYIWSFNRTDNINTAIFAAKNRPITDKHRRNHVSCSKEK